MEETSLKEPQEKIIYVPVAQPMESVQEENEINLLDIWKILWAGKWFIMGFTLACTLVAVYVTLNILPIVYKSDAVLLPNKSETSNGFSNLVANLALPASLSGRGGRTDKVMSFLQSRTLKARLIEKYNLLPRYYPGIWDSEKKQWTVDEGAGRPSLVKALQGGLLDGAFRVTKDQKSGHIFITWEDKTPEFCKIMILRVIEELRFFLENEYETDAKRELEFVKNQLMKTTKELEYWETRIPSQILTLAKIQRERLASQKVYAELRKQLELAKIAEDKEVINFTVLDPPYVPERRFKPARSRICMLTIFTSGIFAVFVVFGYRFIVNLRSMNNDKK